MTYEGNSLMRNKQKLLPYKAKQPGINGEGAWSQPKSVLLMLAGEFWALKFRNLAKVETHWPKLFNNVTMIPFLGSATEGSMKHIRLYL